MTKIKLLGDRIIFDGHADTQRECETVTLMCDNLAKSEDFKTIKYESGYAEFEKVGNVKDVKDLMFAPAGTNYTMVFDSHITKVSATDSYDQTFEWITSGQTTDGSYAFNGTAQVFTVTLQDGYVIDTVTSDETGSSISIAADGMSFTTSLLGDSTSGGTVTVTITSKQGGASKQTIDVSTLSGWESLASGNHSITIKTKASGYLDSASSNAVTVSKERKLYPPTISIADGTITVTDDSRNTVVSNRTQMLYFNDTLITSKVSLSGNIPSLIRYGSETITAGTYNVSVKIKDNRYAPSDKYETSDSSNIVEYNYVLYPITFTLTNVTAGPYNRNTIAQYDNDVNHPLTLNFNANDGYILPDDVTVTGANYNWNKNDGTLRLNNPTGNVSITITGVQIEAGYNVTVTSTTGYSYGLTISDGNSTLSRFDYDTEKGEATVVCSTGKLFLTSDSGNYTDSATVVTGGVSIISEDTYPYSGEFSVTGDGTITVSPICFVEGTQITLADGSTKPVEDIDYTDDILVWDFDNGVQSSAKPCWIAKPNVAPCYWEITLSDGTILKLVGANGKSHRLFNSRGKFVYPQDFENGEHTVKQDGSTLYIVKCEKIYKEVKYYNFATDRALNNYANGVLCGCRFSNVYPIEDMKYVKDDRALATREEYKEIPDKLFYGLRLAEQQNLNDSSDNVNYYHTMKEHVIHNYIEHERDYTGNADYETWLFKRGKK